MKTSIAYKGVLSLVAMLLLVALPAMATRDRTRLYAMEVFIF